jgi:hypothetical protein
MLRILWRIAACTSPWAARDLLLIDLSCTGQEGTRRGQGGPADDTSIPTDRTATAISPTAPGSTLCCRTLGVSVAASLPVSVCMM